MPSSFIETPPLQKAHPWIRTRTYSVTSRELFPLS
jgi:hypothetical protein